MATGFSFSIPTTATISGILLEIERREQSITSTQIRDLDVRLIKDGDANTLSENKARLNENWSGNDTYVSYGGTNDVWLTTWTPAQINNSGFGLVLGVAASPFPGEEKAWVDHFRITVHYTYARTCQ